MDRKFQYLASQYASLEFAFKIGKKSFQIEIYRNILIDWIQSLYSTYIPLENIGDISQFFIPYAVPKRVEKLVTQNMVK